MVAKVYFRAQDAVGRVRFESLYEAEAVKAEELLERVLAEH